MVKILTEVPADAIVLRADGTSFTEVVKPGASSFYALKKVAPTARIIATHEVLQREQVTYYRVGFTFSGRPVFIEDNALELAMVEDRQKLVGHEVTDGMRRESDQRLDQYVEGRYAGAVELDRREDVVRDPPTWGAVVLRSRLLAVPRR